MWCIKTFITVCGCYSGKGFESSHILHSKKVHSQQRHVKGPSANITQASDLYKYTLHGVNNAETHHST